jgi:tRNA modification GTPase
MRLLDTIVAPITAVPGPVAIVRVSGPRAWEVARSAFEALPDSAEVRRLYYGTFATGDEGYAALFDERGYTGEQSAELHCHGSRAAVDALLRECEAAGARAAEPGEFTQRAFLHGRIELTQAEAVRDTIEADTAVQLRQANLLREGALGRSVSAVRDRIIAQIAAVEASVDFSEEVGDLDRVALAESTEEALAEVRRLLQTSEVGRILRGGYRIAIVGPPNAGKSSLLNALLNEERAIVTEIPGTTRDYVEELVDFQGLPVALIDTAGLRETTDPVEEIGIQRTLSIAAGADEVWYVYDAAAGWTQRDQEELESFEKPATVLANKSDIVRDESVGLAISAETGEGLDQLVDLTVQRIVQDRDLATSPLINARHEEALLAAQEALQMTLRTAASEVPDDLLAVTLREAADYLGRITGETSSEDMLERIFRDFCIGK